MPKITQEEKAVAARLRREFAASRPEFSQGLHEQLCRAIRPQTAGGATHRRRHFFAWAMVAAAACLLVGAFAVWHGMGRTSHSGPRSVAGASKPGMGRMMNWAGRVAARTDAAVGTAVESQRWVFLDQDARTVLQTPAARLPLDVVSSLLQHEHRHAGDGDQRAAHRP
jgi:hypothetical protein